MVTLAAGEAMACSAPCSPSTLPVRAALLQLYIQQQGHAGGLAALSNKEKKDSPEYLPFRFFTLGPPLLLGPIQSRNCQAPAHPRTGCA